MNLEHFATPVSQNDSRNLLIQINTKLENQNKLIFPGYQPVTFMKCHMKNILNEDYLVCEKSDGIRALLFTFTVEEKGQFAFFLDRKNVFYKLEGIFPTIETTIFDGEVVVDSETANNETFNTISEDGKASLKAGQIHYIINDTLMFNDENVTTHNLIDRLSYALKYNNVYNTCQNQLKVSVKQMQKSYGLRCVFDEIKKLKHESDGLIFTPVNSSYTSGTAKKLLKWKPPHLNSVDLFVEKNPQSDLLFNLFCFNKDGQKIFFDYYFAETEDLDLNEKIGEFRYDSEKVIYDLVDLAELKGGWELIKIRTDKTTPNSASVLINVLKSIKEDVSIDYLSEHIGKIRGSWKSREVKKL